MKSYRVNFARNNNASLLMMNSAEEFPALNAIKPQRNLVADVGIITVKVFRMTRCSREEHDHSETEDLTNADSRIEVAEKLLKGTNLTHGTRSDLVTFQCVFRELMCHAVLGRKPASETAK